jgi:signal transduction histidine kinase
VPGKSPGTGAIALSARQYGLEVSSASAQPLPAPTRARGRRLAVSIAATLLAAFPLAAILCAVLFLPGTEDDASVLKVVGVLVVGVPAVMGWTIQQRRPGHPIGWLLMAHAAFLTVSFSFDAYADWSIHRHGGELAGTALAAYASQATWPAWFAGLAAIAYVFPDGHLPSPRWRPFAIGAVVAFVGFMTIALFDHSKQDPPYQHLKNPLPELPTPVVVIGVLCLFGIMAGLIGGALAVRTRLKRAAGTERLQILWLAYAALSIPGALLLCWTDAALNDGEIGNLTLAGVLFMSIVVPLAIGIAILRHGLFDIELVLSRTLVYGTLSALVVATYIGVLAGASALIGSRGAAGLIAVGIVAVSIQPLHARLQRRVDRLVYGDRLHPYAALQRLSARLQGTLSPAEVVQTIVDSVAEALRLPYVGVELAGAAAGPIAVRGEPGRGRTERRELSYRGHPEGTLVVEVPPGRDLVGADSQLLDELVRHAGVAVQSVRLLEDLQHSRRELVTAREEERRRLRRDLHDGLGPTLAAISLQLELLGDHVDEKGAPLVERLARDVQGAIADIRTLVYALRPPVLDEYGLLSALSEQAMRLSSEACSMTVDGPDPMPKLPAAVEVAAYRVALEAMTNVQRHAGATRCAVTLAVNGTLDLTVRDDGVGIAAGTGSGTGVGLGSMRERAAELGGTLSVDSRPGDGTAVHASFPLGPG